MAPFLHHHAVPDVRDSGFLHASGVRGRHGTDGIGVIGICRPSTRVLASAGDGLVVGKWWCLGVCGFCGLRLALVAVDVPDEDDAGNDGENRDADAYSCFCA